MAMEPVPTARPATTGFGGGSKGPRGKGKGKFGDKRAPRDAGDRTGGKYTPKLLGKAYFQRKKGCPFSGPKAPKIDYKDVRLLTKYISDYGKILPRHLTGVCALKQRELAQAIKRARILALLPYTSRADMEAPRNAFRSERGPRGDRSFGRGDRGAQGAAPATDAPAAE